MGMPDAYKCEICGIDVAFPGDNDGEAELRAHYESNHRDDPIPAEYNAYKCPHCDDVFKETACEIVQHDRDEHKDWVEP